MISASAWCEHRTVTRLERLLAAIPSNPDAFLQACRDETDWPTLLEFAFQHSVEDVIYHQGLALGFRFPADITEQCTRWRSIKLIWHRHAVARLSEAVAALDATGVDTVALKGPILGERLYHSPAARFGTDLDILIRDAQRHQALDALQRIGYAVDESEKGADSLGHEIWLLRDTPPKLELHTALHWLTDGHGVFDRLTSYQTQAGFPVRILSPEDEFLYLCVHAAGHWFSRLSHLYDLKLFLPKHPHLDWHRIRELSEAQRVKSALAFACRLLVSRHGVEDPNVRETAATFRAGLADRLLSLRSRNRQKSRLLYSFSGRAYGAILIDPLGGALSEFGHQTIRDVKSRFRRLLFGN